MNSRPVIDGNVDASDAMKTDMPTIFRKGLVMLECQMDGVVKTTITS